MNSDPSQLLQQLRDIHAVGEPSMWPPAPGWWVLAVLLLLVLAALMRWWLRKLALRRRQQAWLQVVDEMGGETEAQADPQAWLAGLNRLFRAVALRAFPDTNCARLEGEEWVAFIRGLMPENAATDHLSALAVGPYQPQPDFDPAALADSARLWVKRYG